VPGAPIEGFPGVPLASADQVRIAELERMVGRLAMELEAVKKASSLLHSR
jgi:hypothetical protein